jgi:hypothetical protein
MIRADHVRSNVVTPRGHVVNDIGSYDNRRATIAWQLVVGSTTHADVAMNAATARTRDGIAQRGGNDETVHIVETPRVKVRRNDRRRQLSCSAAAGRKRHVRMSYTA